MDAIEQAVDGRRSAMVRCPFCLALNRVNLGRLADGPRCGECKRPLLLDRPVRASDEDFDRIIGETDVPVLVDFYADWCGPCRIMAPILDEYAQARVGEVLVVKLDTDASPVTPSRYEIRGIPTLVAFRGGREIGRHVGLATRRALDELVASRSSPR
jgi:thioredoxin 2